MISINGPSHRLKNRPKGIERETEVAQATFALIALQLSCAAWQRTWPEQPRLRERLKQR
ncbi:hypothetical protein GCM10010211_77610 [Streptomyces albospinus]|uniref:Transposase n=1 Tax=Streptomyces albospinus TaxID=285515 RepID=A0ABQ2VQW1_9ACTN|nr:hypothetical protein GCM10010211_77610 [Streptomyces albospinus]